MGKREGREESGKGRGGYWWLCPTMVVVVTTAITAATIAGPGPNSGVEGGEWPQPKVTGLGRAGGEMAVAAALA